LLAASGVLLCNDPAPSAGHTQIALNGKIGLLLQGTN